jgi:hypothetical protein
VKQWRKNFIVGLLAFIVGFHVYDVLARRDHWPISNYPMYSKLQTENSFWTVRIVAYTDEDPPRRLVEKSTYLRTLVSKLIRREDRNLTRLVRVMKDHFDDYAQREKLHGVKIEEVRVYRERWNLRPDASNRDEPDLRELFVKISFRTSVPKVTTYATSQPVAPPADTDEDEPEQP